MKTKNEEKLILKKSVVSSLDRVAMQSINGGSGDTITTAANSTTSGISMLGGGQNTNTATKTGTSAY